MKSSLAALVLVGGVSLSASAAEDIADYAYRTGIAPERAATWYRVEIPAHVQWRAAHSDLRDVRVFDAKGESMPFALTKSETRRTQDRREAPARLFPLYADESSDGGKASLHLAPSLRIRRDADGAVEIDVREAEAGTRPTGRGAGASQPGKTLSGWLIDASALDFVPERLMIDWVGKQEGLFRFTIEGSDDIEHWRGLGSGQIVQLSFNGESITQREFDLPRRKFRYLRLRWQDARYAVGVRGARLSGRVVSVETVSAPFAWSGPLVGEALAGREGEYVWNFPLCAPLARVSIVIDETSALAPVIFSGRCDPPPNALARPNADPLALEPLYSRPRVRDAFRSRSRTRERARARAQTRERDAWRTLASGLVYRLPSLSEGGGEELKNELDLPGVSVKQLRLQVDPRGGLGAKPPVIEVALPARDLVFLARGDAPYRLAVGKPDARAADLPLASLVPVDVEQAAASGRLARARLTDDSGARTPSANVPANAPSEDGELPVRRIVLWALLAAGVALLGGMIFSLLRPAKDIDKSTIG
ncbi:MAG: DUF3999 domain-containing protein [Candidatus Accumulibacter sp.]|jgi:hypothetical protein|nr:DUF3999 domain-containing protein [Accumulibacter sp.]